MRQLKCVNTSIFVVCIVSWLVYGGDDSLVRNISQSLRKGVLHAERIHSRFFLVRKKFDWNITAITTNQITERLAHLERKL